MHWTDGVRVYSYTLKALKRDIWLPNRTANWKYVEEQSPRSIWGLVKWGERCKLQHVFTALFWTRYRLQPPRRDNVTTLHMLSASPNDLTQHFRLEKLTIAQLDLILRQLNAMHALSSKYLKMTPMLTLLPRFVSHVVDLFPSKFGLISFTHSSPLECVPQPLFM
jgi:hypothetical protein